MRPPNSDLLTAAIAAGLDLAVLYLRVSTKRQQDTAVDIDPDGNSIATQRVLGNKRAEGIGATVVKEFVEPHSAKTVDERKVFREVLAYLHAHPEIKYLIVYMRSRAFRNRFDDHGSVQALTAAGTGNYPADRGSVRGRRAVDIATGQNGLASNS